VLPEAHRRLSSLGAKPTYLIDYPVANNPAAAAILRSFIADDEALIGAQLHPWVNPPFDEAISNANSFAGNLPPAMEQAKLAILTNKIREMIGIQPAIYRAGRYGVGPSTAKLLIELGYELDVSTRPLFDYSSEGGPDFSSFPAWPWWVDADRRLLEMPLSAIYAGYLRRRGGRLFPATAGLPLLRGALAKSGLLQRVALTPEGMPLKDVIQAIDIMLDQPIGVFSLSFHSPSLRPGNTPYVRDQAELRNFWNWWHKVLDRFARAGVQSACVHQFVDAARSAAQTPA